MRKRSTRMKTDFTRIKNMPDEFEYMNAPQMRAYAARARRHAVEEFRAGLILGFTLACALFAIGGLVAVFTGGAA